MRTVGMTVNPIQASEIEAWSRLMDERPTPWEVEALLRMDAAFLERIHKKARAQAPSETTVKGSDTKGVASFMEALAKVEAIKAEARKKGAARGDVH
jgi:hypothetical protein